MGVSSVNSSSSSRELKSADNEASKKRAIVKDGDNKESDAKAKRAQDDDKGKKVDAEA